MRWESVILRGTVLGRRKPCGDKHQNESSASGGAVAYASAAVSRPGNSKICAAVDAVARLEGLLGHGENSGRISGVPCHFQRGAVAGNAVGRIRQRKIPRA